MSSRWQKLGERWRGLPALIRGTMAVTAAALLSFSTFRFLRGSSVVLWLPAGKIGVVVLFAVVMWDHPPDFDND